MYSYCVYIQVKDTCVQVWVRMYAPLHTYAQVCSYVRTYIRVITTEVHTHRCIILTESCLLILVGQYY